MACRVCKHDSYGAPLTVCEGRDGRGCQGDFEVCPLCQPEQEDHPRCAALRLSCGQLSVALQSACFLHCMASTAIWLHVLRASW